MERSVLCGQSTIDEETRKRLVKLARGLYALRMLKASIFVLHLLLASVAIGFSQEGAQADNADPAKEASDERGRKDIWEANLRGGNYVVKLSGINSVSRHEYVLDGALVVDEVTIDTAGQALAGFYFFEPVSMEVAGSTTGELNRRAMELIEKGAEKTGTKVHEMVSKVYPATTHAKSIEYRIFTKSELDRLWQSGRVSGIEGRGRVFTGSK